MLERVQRVVLQVFGALPRPVRRLLVRAGSPRFTVGAICVVRRNDGAVLLVRHSYWRRWGTPGGLAKRGERPEQAALRETMEEVNLPIELVAEPVVVVEPRSHRVDVVFLARPVPGAPLDDVRPSSPEITALAWFSLDDLPDVQAETATALAALARAGLLPELRPSSGRPTR